MLGVMLTLAMTGPCLSDGGKVRIRWLCVSYALVKALLRGSGLTVFISTGLPIRNTELASMLFFIWRMAATALDLTPAFKTEGKGAKRQWAGA